MHAATQSPNPSSNAPGVACGDLVVHWERGYRCHGLWRENQRLARVSLGPPHLWKSGRDEYMWETERPPLCGTAKTLRAAKRAAERSLHNDRTLATQPAPQDSDSKQNAPAGRGCQQCPCSASSEIPINAETPMKTEEEKQAGRERHRRAVEAAKKILKPGDKIRVERCCRRKATITFAGWDGNWIVSKSGGNDYSPGCVDRLNGQPVDFSGQNEIADSRHD